MTTGKVIVTGKIIALTRWTFVGKVMYEYDVGSDLFLKRRVVI